MRVGILTTGDDILKGKTLNTNFNYLAKRLWECGASVSFEISSADNKESIREALQFLIKKSEGVIVIGGLGPTHDDQTREGFSEFIKQKPFFDEILWQNLKKLEPELQKEKHEKYAWNFRNTKLLENPAGIARGYFYEKKGSFIFLLPGPPREFIPMLEKHVLPYIKRKTGKSYETKVIKIFGLKEIEVMEKLKEKEEVLKPFSILPSLQEVKVVLYGEKEEIKRKFTILKRIVGDYIYSEKEETLEEIVGRNLKKKKLTISTAESCTGGLLGDIITRVPGSSEYYKGGIVAYTEEIKVDVLKVKEETIKKYSVYSGEVAKEMAENVRKIFKTDIGISTTGIAGPSGGTKNKPVGLVYMGICLNGKTFVFKEIFKGEREEIKMQSALFILNELRKKLKEEKK